MKWNKAVTHMVSNARSSDGTDLQWFPTGAQEVGKSAEQKSYVPASGPNQKAAATTNLD